MNLLRRDGLVRDHAPRLTPLAGGVSCEIYLVEDGAERFVVKRALAKLKVKADWFADVKRNRHEWEFIRYVARFQPEAVPKLRHSSTAENYFTMEHLNGDFSNWKEMLLAGKGTDEYAGNAGKLLAQIHGRSTGDPEAAKLFDTTPTFFQLRIEPFLLATGEKNSPLSPMFKAEAERLARTRECLVHGDFSPKNILVSTDRMVLLDGEVAWYGEPAFDLAFLMAHLFLKALYHAPHASGGRTMIEKFWRAYQTARPAPELEPRVSRLLLMLLLARVDGKSPVEYLNPARQDLVREFVRAKLPGEIPSLAAITEAWFTRLHQFQN
ncbi:MAG TPA: aminoglycoside phosphotransferase family protein [Verrucomicrobiae bacterium]